jgi:hypothetical protein
MLNAKCEERGPQEGHGEQKEAISREDVESLTTVFGMVPTEGVEPTHPFGYQILSLARLPIPPHRPPLITKHLRK